MGLKMTSFPLGRIAVTGLLAGLGLTLATGSGVSVAAGTAAAKSPCRTRVVDGSAGTGHASMVLHPCDRVKVEFSFGTQGEIVPDWEMSRRPNRKVFRFVSKKNGPYDASNDVATVIFLYQATGKGKTSVRFGEYTASYPGTELDSFTLSVVVRQRRA
jgi:hypothetical protein